MQTGSPLQRVAAWMAEHEIWGAALALVAGLLWTQLLPVTVLYLFLIWPLRWFAWGHFSIRTPFDLAILVLLFTLPVTLAVSIAPQITLVQLLRLVAGIGFYYALTNWTTSMTRLRLVVNALLVMLPGLAVIAPFVTGDTPMQLTRLPTSLYKTSQNWLVDTINPNVLAGSLVFLLPLAWSMLVFAWESLSRWERLLAGSAAAAGLLALIFTQSRGAWLAGCTAFLTLVCLRWRRGWLTALAAGLVAVLTAWLLGWSGANTASPSMVLRREVWLRASYMLADFPLTGIGMGTFDRVADLLYPYFLLEPGHGDHAHNLFLQVGVDLGLPGLIAWVACLASGLALAWQLYRSSLASRARWVTGIGAGLLAAQLAMVVHGLVDSILWGMVRTSPLVWAIWGTVAAAWMVAMSTATNRQQRKSSASV